jgi:hypothetical protein
MAQEPLVLEFASERLRNDKGIALDALRASAGTLEFLSERRRHDTDVGLIVERYARQRDYKSPVSGEEIMRACGLQEGREVG